MNYAGPQFAAERMSDGDGACILGICDGSGFLYDEETNTAYDCRCRPQIIARTKARSLSRSDPRSATATSAFDRFPVTEIDPHDRRRDAALRRPDRRERSTPGAACGSWGPSAPARRRSRCWSPRPRSKAGRSAARYSLPGLLSQIRKTFDTGSHNDLLERLVAVDLLHIDDIGAEQTTPWVLEELYSIVNARYEEQRSIVITTNILDRETLCEQITRADRLAPDRDVRRAAAARPRPPHGPSSRLRA